MKTTRRGLFKMMFGAAVARFAQPQKVLPNPEWVNANYRIVWLIQDGYKRPKGLQVPIMYKRFVVTPGVGKGEVVKQVRRILSDL